MPDESWKGSGTCTWNLKAEDKVYEAWEEGSQPKESSYKITGGTGKYEAASGGGTYTLDPKSFAEPLSGGTYNGKLELP